MYAPVPLPCMLFPDFSQFGADEYVLIAACFCCVALIVHYFLSIFPVAGIKKTRLAETPELKPLSVIICARNEDDNLTEFLPKVLTQDYPEFEVLIVNDCSWDNTENVIDEFAKIFPNLRKLNIKEDDYYKHGKKFAVMVGIKGAKHEQLVFTDADCVPASDQWLRDMAMGFAPGKEIVLGYGAYQKEPGFLNKLIRFDTFQIAAQYLSAAVKGKAYMGVGRNLAYHKSLFFKHKGFSSHYHINSGDDDLFINEACTPDNTNICVSHQAITLSVPEKTFRNWRLQKQRHLTTAPYYNSATKLRITMSYLWVYLFYLSLAGLCCFRSTLIAAGALFFLKILFQMIIFRKASKTLNEPDLWLLSFLHEFALLFTYPVFHLSRTLAKRNKWAN